MKTIAYLLLALILGLEFFSLMFTGRLSLGVVNFCFNGTGFVTCN
jgi:hypothetical protein